MHVIIQAQRKLPKNMGKVKPKGRGGKQKKILPPKRRAKSSQHAR